MYYNDILFSKPVYVMNIKKQLRLNGNDISKLQQTLFEGEDANYINKNVRSKGLINFSALLEFKFKFQQKLSIAVSKFNPTTMVDDLNKIYDTFNNVIDTFF